MMTRLSGYKKPIHEIDSRRTSIRSTALNVRVWAVSLAVWVFVTLAATATIYQLYRTFNNGSDLKTVAAMQFSQVFTYAPLTPFAFALAIHFPIQRERWVRRCFLHLAFALLFTFGHMILQGATPYGYWDPTMHNWSSTFWNSHTHAFQMPWVAFRSMFLSNIVNDVSSAYLPIVFVAEAISYYRRSREGELRATQLEAQLATARLQSLKSQLQPHFLFNTLHSISALMLTDVAAADRMMCRLSDLLRLSLETADTQITTLKRELEFVNCYLEIEKVRFEERLKVNYSIAPETLDAELPHLLLQPLVDNAVKHGIAKAPNGGEISIVSRCIEGKLQIEIQNNGVTSSPRHTTATGGVGLRVTKERLASIYGEDQIFELENSPDGHTTARVEIPWKMQAGEPGKSDREEKEEILALWH